VAVDAVCPRCGESAVPTGERMITCRSCAMVFEPRAERVRPPTATVELPAEMTREREGDKLRVIWPYDDAGQMLVAALMIGVPFWLAAYFVPVWWALAIAGTIGAVAVYVCIARIVSKRILEIGPETLTLRSRPLPFRPRISVKRDVLTEAALRVFPRRSKRPPYVQLFVRVRGGGEVVLFKADDDGARPHEQLGPLRDLINEICELPAARTREPAHSTPD